ncbi:hypothetical protein EDB19DRAFT_1908747 [Suillus lakei]|nr:hypothetical protein EDB19DRAFT_1908747 [Suillus lakei]
MSLKNLADSLRGRFKQHSLSVMSDLDEAIKLNRAVLALHLADYPDQSLSLQQGVMSDLDKAIELNRAALTLLPSTSLPGAYKRDPTSGESCLTWMGPSRNPDQSTSLNSLAISLLDRFQQHGRSSDLEEASSLYLQVPEVSVASHGDFRVAKPWALSTEYPKHGSALVAYQTALKSLDQEATSESLAWMHSHAVFVMEL